MAVADVTDAEMIRLYTETGIDLSQLPAVMTAAELAPAIGLSVASLSQERYLNKGIPYIKLGHRVRYLRADVARYLLANRRETETA